MTAHTRRADILIVAAGRPRAITADMVKPGAVVVDVGINEMGKTAEGKRILVGDVDFDSVKEVASAITPVPGGVGPIDHHHAHAEHPAIRPAARREESLTTKARNQEDESKYTKHPLVGVARRECGAGVWVLLGLFS